MHNIKFIRSNPDKFDKSMTDRGLEKQSEEILTLDKNNRELIKKIDVLKFEKNTFISTVYQEKKILKDDEKKIIKDLNDEISLLQKNQNECKTKLHDILTSLPNILDDKVPYGKNEADNIGNSSHITHYGGHKRDHIEIGKNLNLIDVETAVKMSGSKFILLKGDLVRLERALISFMFDVIKEFDYEEISPPILVNKNAMFNTGHLPKFENELYKTTDEKYLIPTGEVPLTNIVSDSIININDLPLRFTTCTPCFRREAGAAGKNSRGLIRQHQFHKVELVSITHPDESDKELVRMIEIVKKMLMLLNLPIKTILLCSGDTGFSSSITYDINVFLPAQYDNKGNEIDGWLEISSISNCKDFQSRRMNARLEEKNKKRKQFVHTLNGSALAIGRTITAIITNYYNKKDNTIDVPLVLQSYMGGIKKLGIKNE